MHPVHLLLSALNPAQVEDAIEALHEARHAAGLSPARPLPLGGTPATSWTDGKPNAGETWNNCHHAEMVSDPAVALFERLRNGDDTIIDLFDKNGWFEGTDENFDDSIKEVAESTSKARVYLMTTEEHMGGVKVATVIDTGVGIPAHEFSTGIMATGSSNKVWKRRLAGSYGVGGSTTLAFSEYTIIASRHVDNPDILAYTVAFRYYDETVVGTKGASYAYLVDENGHALTVNIADLDPLLMWEPHQITDTNYLKSVGKSIIPAHGTVVRMVGFPLGSNTDTWNNLRNFGFGLPVAHCLINGLGKQKRLKLDEDFDEDDEERGADRKHVTYPIGLRHTLDNPKRNTGNRTQFHVEYRQPPFTLLTDDGSVTVRAWLMPTAISSKGKPRKPTAELMPGNAANGIVVTLTGQIHDRMSTKLLLDECGLSYLDQNLIIEIDCSRLSYPQRREWFTSNRQQMKTPVAKSLRARLKAWLMGSESLHEWNQTYRERVITGGAAKKTNRDLLTRLNQFFSHVIGGATPVPVGGPGAATAGQEQEAMGSAHKPRAYIKPIELHEPPTWIELRRESIELGTQEAYFAIRTDAKDRFDGQIDLVVMSGDFLTVHGHTGLHRGRDSIIVSCAETATIGDVAEVYVTLTLDDGSKLASAVREVVVVEPKKEEPRKKSPRVSQLDIRPERVTPTDASWSAISPETIQTDEIAFNYVKAAPGVYDCFINMTFAPYIKAINELKRDRYRQSVIDAFTNDYEFDSVAAAAIMINRDAPTVNMSEVHNWRAGQMQHQVWTRLCGITDSIMRKAA